MMSKQGMAVLSEIFSVFRSDFLEEFPGSNENDVERAFLVRAHFGLEEAYPSADMLAKIEAIV